MRNERGESVFRRTSCVKIRADRTRLRRVRPRGTVTTRGADGTVEAERGHPRRLRDWERAGRRDRRAARTVVALIAEARWRREARAGAEAARGTVRAVERSDRVRDVAVLS